VHLKLKSNWREIVKTINGFFGVDGLNTSEGLGMKYGGSVKGPEDWGGGAFWYTGNSRIFVNSIEENLSLLELKTDDQPADDTAINTFAKLRPLLEWKPWEHIPNKGTDRYAIKLYCEGKSHKEIGELLSIGIGPAGTKISRLRKRYPEARIPNRNPPKKKTDEVLIKSVK
jgi:hypothetical protein